MVALVGDATLETTPTTEPAPEHASLTLAVLSAGAKDEQFVPATERPSKLAESSDTHPPSSQDGLTRFDGRADGSALWLLALEKEAVEDAVEDADEEDDEEIVEHDKRFLKLFMLLDIFALSTWLVTFSFETLA